MNKMVVTNILYIFYADKKCFYFCPLLWPSSRKYMIYKWNLLCVYSDVYIIQYASGNLLFYQALPVLSRMEKRLKKEGWLLMPQSCSLENWRNVQFSESKISIFCNWHLESTQSSQSVQTFLINTFLMLISGVIATLVLAMGSVWCGVLSVVCLFFVRLFFFISTAGYSLITLGLSVFHKGWGE